MTPPRLQPASPEKTGLSHAPTVVIGNIWPSLEGGRHPVKRIAGDALTVWADVFRDGHGKLAAVLKWRRRGISAWEEAPMTPLENDRWRGECTLLELGEWEYTIEAWQDEFLTWRHEFRRKADALGPGEALETESIEGSILFEESAKRAEQGGHAADAETLRRASRSLYGAAPAAVLETVADPELQALAARWTNRSLSTTAVPLHRVLVERERAGFSSWYEFFPRGAEGRADKHSTFRDCLERIRYARDLGFHIVYFPPIHPIGVTFRKGKDNALTCGPDDVGSPWAIGSAEGGHRAVHPALGTLEDFDWLVREAKELGMEIALDFAINCSPDHPYVKEHPDWFFQRPDGTIKYAENPPKKYQDIYPLDFHCRDWRALWEEMVRVVLFWAERGVRIFRVDNPHTKPVAFWEYLISEVRSQHPDTIFLSEAFTRPRMMEMLAKVGFTQSYTYFTWRVHRQELIDYIQELAHSDLREYFRGNFWPNTPDILAVPLDGGSPAVFRVRAALAALTMPNWGIYSGFEFCENERHPDREEYRHNEKYELKARDWSQPGIKDFIARLNHLRNTHAEFQRLSNIRFLPVDNDHLMAFARTSPTGARAIVVIINLDPDHTREGTVTLPHELLPEPDGAPYGARDLMDGECYTWHGPSNWVSLNPSRSPLHVFRLESASSARPT
jgi:starch synthase (maltosyl-transferring)